MEQSLLEKNVLRIVFLISGKYICSDRQVKKSSHLFGELGYRENRMKSLIKDLENAYKLSIPTETAYAWKTSADIINYISGHIQT